MGIAKVAKKLISANFFRGVFLSGFSHGISGKGIPLDFPVDGPAFGKFFAPKYGGGGGGEAIAFLFPLIQDKRNFIGELHIPTWV